MAKPPLRQRGQWSLIGLLAALAIVVILAAITVPQIAARHSEPGEPRTPIERGYGAACSAYVGQLNQAAEMYKSDHDGQPPTDLEQLKKYGVTEDQIHAEGCYFVIDPGSGTVSDRGLSQAQPQAPPPSYTAPAAPGGANTPAIGFHGDSEDGDSSGITPSTAPQSAQPGPGGVKIPTIPTQGM
jgi:type II secretory pathway pseudopilin PulG